MLLRGYMASTPCAAPTWSWRSNEWCLLSAGSGHRGQPPFAPPQPVVTARTPGACRYALRDRLRAHGPALSTAPGPHRPSATARTAGVSPTTPQPWALSKPASDVLLATPCEAISQCASSPTISVTLGSGDSRARVCAPEAHLAWPRNAGSMFHVEHLGLAPTVNECPGRHTATARALCAAAPRVAPSATTPRR